MAVSCRTINEESRWVLTTGFVLYSSHPSEELPTAKESYPPYDSQLVQMYLRMGSARLLILKKSGISGIELISPASVKGKNTVGNLRVLWYIYASALILSEIGGT